jgi:hypothetical protein
LSSAAGCQPVDRRRRRRDVAGFGGPEPTRPARPAVPPAGLKPAISCVKGVHDGRRLTVGCRYLQQKQGFRARPKGSHDQLAATEASIRLPRRAVPLDATVGRARLCRMAVKRAAHVTLSGDISGDYVVVETREDGSVVVRPDTSIEAIRWRHDATPATLEEFVAEYGPIQPPDGEG